MSIAVSEFTVMAFMLFLSIARNVVHWARTDDPRVRSSCLGILVPLSDDLCHCITDLGVFAMVDRTSFRSVEAWLAFYCSMEVDRDSLRIVGGPKFLHYNFESGEVIGLPEASSFAEADSGTKVTKTLEATPVIWLSGVEEFTSEQG